MYVEVWDQRRVSICQQPERVVKHGAEEFALAIDQFEQESCKSAQPTPQKDHRRGRLKRDIYTQKG